MARARSTSGFLVDPPARELRVASDGAELFVRIAGEPDAAEAVLVVPAGPGLSHQYLEGLEALASASAGGRAVVRYDPRGVGRSTGAVERAWVFEQAVADLEAVRAALAFDHAHLLGHAYGGLIAALHAATFAARTSSLILVDGLPPTSAALATAQARCRVRLGQYQARGLVPTDLPELDQDPRARLLAVLPIYFLDPRHPGARSLNGATLSPEVARATAPALAAYDVRERLAAIDIPTLAVHTPVPFGLEMGAALGAAIPGARTQPLREAGHLPWVEGPRAFLQEVRRFLTESTPRPAAGRPA